jgi:ferrochelatase
LLRWTYLQAEALAEKLGVPVYFGMRNWHPYLSDVLGEARSSGIERLAAICLAPQYSALSVGQYIRAAEQARSGIEIAWARSFHDEPLLIEAFAERLAPLAEGRRVIFTAHSLPVVALTAGDPYDRECRATAAAVAAKVGVAEWDFAYQSQGLAGGEWLGPTVESLLDHASGEVVIAPIGFVCDHVEVLYDIDVHFRRYGAERGVTVLRPPSLNDSTTFTAALAEVARRCLG